MGYNNYVSGFEVFQALINANLPSYLHTRSLLRLALMNKALHQYVYHVICDTLVFRIRDPFYEMPKHYKMKNLLFEYDSSSIDGSLVQFMLSLKEYFFPPVDNLPFTITHLLLGDHFNHPVDYLPNTLTHLTCGKAFNQPVDYLPSSITSLTFGHDFNQPVDYLPSSITHLTFGHNFNQMVDYLPENIIYLTFGRDFNQPVEYLPSTITHLTFGVSFCQSTLYLSRNITYLKHHGKIERWLKYEDL